MVKKSLNYCIKKNNIFYLYFLDLYLIYFKLIKIFSNKYIWKYNNKLILYNKININNIIIKHSLII